MLQIVIWGKNILETCHSKYEHNIGLILLYRNVKAFCQPKYSDNQICEILKCISQKRAKLFAMTFVKCKCAKWF